MEVGSGLEYWILLLFFSPLFQLFSLWSRFCGAFPFVCLLHVKSKVQTSRPSLLPRHTTFSPNPTVVYFWISSFLGSLGWCDSTPWPLGPLDPLVPRAAKVKREALGPADKFLAIGHDGLLAAHGCHPRWPSQSQRCLVDSPLLETVLVGNKPLRSLKYRTPRRSPTSIELMNSYYKKRSIELLGSVIVGAARVLRDTKSTRKTHITKFHRLDTFDPFGNQRWQWEIHGNPLIPYAPCMEYLYTYIWVIYGANVGKYSIEHMGIQMELKKIL